jgi:2-keto-4-pentenoate hydratase
VVKQALEMNINKIAKRQLRDYRNINPGTCFSTDNFDLSINEAYAVQEAVVELRSQEGETVIGYKVGCTGPGTTKLFGMEGPIRGTLFDSEIHESGVELNADHFFNLAIEAEMAVKIGDDGEINLIFPIIELHNFVFRASKKSLSELIANNGLNRGIILSNKNWHTPADAYKKTSVLSLERNGSEIDSGAMWPMAGGPQSSLDWLEKHLRDRNLSVNGGDIILAGTALGLHKVKSGDQVNVKIDGKIAVQCTVAFD